jgi:hypothetical protein
MKFLRRNQPIVSVNYGKITEDRAVTRMIAALSFQSIIGATERVRGL